MLHSVAELTNRDITDNHFAFILEGLLCPRRNLKCYTKYHVCVCVCVGGDLLHAAATNIRQRVTE